MSLCDQELQRAYREYNRRWFSNCLPHDVDCFFSPVEPCYGMVLQEEGGFLLQINPRYAVDDRMWRMTLLHECVHLKVHPYKLHGKKFQEEMKRLAIAGAFKNLW